MATDLTPLMTSHLPAATLALLRRASQVASSLGLPFYLVGGPVRDLLLGRQPKDLDLVVEGDAVTLAVRVAESLGGRVTAVSQFGTATVALGDQRIDFATARTESYARPGALPRVAASTLREDLARRDFTINALAADLSEQHFGTLIDLHGGQADLRARLIRILHPRSFVDDATRILRAIRYEQRLGFRIESETSLRLYEALAQGMLDTISGDRLRRELDLTFHEPDPLKPLLRAANLGVLRALHRSLDEAPGLRRLEKGKRPEDPLVYLAVLVSHVKLEEAEEVVRRLNMTARWTAVVRDTIGLRELLAGLADASPVQLCDALDKLSASAARAWALMEWRSPAGQALDRYLSRYRKVRPSLTGRDLLALGVPQGPVVGAVLTRLRQARLDGRVSSRAEELALARSLLSDPSVATGQ